MIFDERTEGDYRIYAGALEAPRGQGYIAALVVNRIGDAGHKPREAIGEILRFMQFVADDTGIIIVPIKSGVGARLGVNLGYVKFTPTATWNPF